MILRRSNYTDCIIFRLYFALFFAFLFAANLIFLTNRPDNDMITITKQHILSLALLNQKIAAAKSVRNKGDLYGTEKQTVKTQIDLSDYFTAADDCRTGGDLRICAL